MSSPATTHPTEPPADRPAAQPRPPSRPALSPSRASDFKQCPLLYRFRAVDRLPEAQSRAQARGTLVHAVLEDLYARPAAERGMETALTLVDPAWERLLLEVPAAGDVVRDEDPVRFLDEARRLVANYYRMEDPTAFEPQSCELRLEIDLAGGIPLRGFVDRIDVAPTGEVRVVDYKTGRAPGVGFEQSALFQLKFYALMLLELRGVVPTQLRLLYLADGEILTYTPEHDELRRFERTLGALWRAILAAAETGDFEPKPGRMCGFCDHKAVCPAFGGTPPPYPGWPSTGAEELSVEENAL